MASIYDTVPNWTAKDYLKYDIVNSPNNNGETEYWYALTDFTSATTPTTSDPNWGGRGSFQNAGVTENLPEFFWVPSYNQSSSIEPRVLTVKFGDGYEQRTPDGINNNLLTLDMSFDKRTEKETLSINHFLNTRRGANPFVFTPPAPFATKKKFICKKFSTNYVFFDNYTVRASFIETPN